MLGKSITATSQARAQVFTRNTISSFDSLLISLAVSRRHASIENTSFGTAVMDLDSRAGTYINGDRIMPGDLYAIKRGDRVSFGTAGADYVFEG